LPNARRDARKEGRFLGIGIANFVELTGRGPYEPATVRITSSGKIHVLSSAAAMGQSTNTMLAQIVAEQLGGDISNVIVTTGDSSSSTTGFGGFGSRQTVTAGSSALIAARKVREKALAVAGHMLEAAAGDLDITGRSIHLKGASDLKISLADVAKSVHWPCRRLSSRRAAARNGGVRGISSSMKWHTRTGPRSRP
jgi:carbon-monoxide dehydrogenase large subunit